MLKDSQRGPSLENCPTNLVRGIRMAGMFWSVLLGVTDSQVLGTKP